MQRQAKAILIVEDNEVTREGLAAILRREGFEVEVASHGDEAMEGIRSGRRPDLILLDMLMPVLDGWHFLSWLRRLGLQPPIPVIVATGTILTPEWAQDNGCQGFLRKPIETEQLLEEIRRCLG